jgi:hypothetical protein
MPPYLKRLQFTEDSTRARRWFETTKDSAYIKKYVSIMKVKSKNNPGRDNNPSHKQNSQQALILTDEKQFRKIYTQSDNGNSA